MAHKITVEISRNLLNLFGSRSSLFLQFLLQRSAKLVKVGCFEYVEEGLEANMNLSSLTVMTISMLVAAASLRTDGLAVRAKRELALPKGLPDASSIHNSNTNLAVASHSAVHAHDTAFLRTIGHGSPTPQNDQDDGHGSHFHITH